VRLRAESRGTELIVTVQDNGCGIPPAEIDHVFDKFERGAVEATGPGMGLGLAICRAIVRLHGGRAWADLVPTGGSAFHFTLPLAEAPRAPAEPVGA